MTTKFFGAEATVTTIKELLPDQLRADLLQPWPRITVRMMLIVLFLLGLFAWGVNGTNARPSELVDGIPNIIDFIRRLFPPRFDMIPVTLALPSSEISHSLSRSDVCDH
jgi:ABC-type phosphate/phosphonate transport system permease subunit